MTAANQTVKVVFRRSGLSAHAIRIWERRYGAVEPERTGTNHRLYSDEQIDRLSLLRDVTQSEHSISYVAKLPTEKLRKLARELHGTSRHDHRSLIAAPVATNFLDECVAAVKSLDTRVLDDNLKMGRHRTRRARPAATRGCHARADPRRVVARGSGNLLERMPAVANVSNL